MFRNLIDNARSFSPPGGEVRGGAAARRPGRVIATVSDDGPGIPPENLETVFERFYTSRPKGAAFGGNSGPRPLHRPPDRRGARRHLRAENRVVDGQVIGARASSSLLPEARLSADARDPATPA